MLRRLYGSSGKAMPTVAYNACTNIARFVSDALASYMPTDMGLIRSSLYRVAPKSQPQTFVYIFAKYWPIFTFFSLAHSVENV